MGAGLGSDLPRVDRSGLAVDQIPVEGVLDPGGSIGRAVEALGIGLVFREKQVAVAFATKDVGRQVRLVRAGDRTGQDGPVLVPRLGAQLRLRAAVRPGPGIAEPEGRQQVEAGRVRPPIADGDAHQQVIRGGLGVFHEDVVIAVVPEYARVEQFVFPLGPGAAPVGRDQNLVGEGRLGILVEMLQVGMSGRAVAVEIVFLDVFPVIALLVGQTEEPLLDDGVPAVPQGQGETQPLARVAYAGQPVLAVAVGAKAGLVVGEEVPGILGVSLARL